VLSYDDLARRLALEGRGKKNRRKRGRAILADTISTQKHERENFRSTRKDRRAGWSERCRGRVEGMAIRDDPSRPVEW